MTVTGPSRDDELRRHRRELRERYGLEREKRLRPDGNQQYLQPSGRYAHLMDDPWTERVDREPVTEDVTVAVIGAGFAGLATAARLVDAGVTDLRILDGGGDVGGAWYWNRYPGAMCDTAAMVYLPLLEETGYLPSRKYVYAPEIQGHARRIAEHWDLYRHALFSTQVTDLRWDAAAHRWIVGTDRGDTIRARYVTMGTGPLHRPKLPGIPGIQGFEGTAFHTSRWDYAATGGDPSGGPFTGLRDRRVGIIGTGATAVQVIPTIAPDCGELFVFQRTPSSIDVRGNHELDPVELDLQPGWQREWLMNFATLQTGGFTDEDLVKDGWTDIAQRIRDRVVASVGAGEEFTPATIARAFADSDDEKMDEIRARVDAVVADPATAEALKPWYRQLCKRPCFHDEYLQAFNRPNVHLVDTDGQGVTRIDATGAWVGDTHVELDCLVFASGFEVGTDYSRRSGYETTGRDGVTLSEYWADGMRSLHGIHSRGFPNLFVVGLAQGSNLISNVTHNLVEAATTIASVIAHGEELAAAAGAHSVEVEVAEDAEASWVGAIDGNDAGLLGTADCTPGYYNNEGGQVGLRERRNVGGYPGGPIAYFTYIDRWRNDGEFRGLEFRTA